MEEEASHVVWGVALAGVASGETDISATQLVDEHLSGAHFGLLAGVEVIQFGAVTACEIAENHDCGVLLKMYNISAVDF